MKYYIRNRQGIFQRWNDKVIYFNCWLDAVAFLESMENIEFLDTEGSYVEPLRSLPFAEYDMIDLTGFIPVANGDSIELKEYAE